MDISISHTFAVNTIFMFLRNKLKYIVLLLSSCSIPISFAFNLGLKKWKQIDSVTSPFIVVLGTAQDGGYPHAGCKKSCCAKYYLGKESRHYVSCLALIDPVTKQRWFFDCTPDFIFQLHALDSIYPVEGNGISGILLTHAHIGHYTGLMYLGREAMNTKKVPVYAMPRMREFLKNNGPWSQLVSIKNIDIRNLSNDSTIHLNDRISITPFIVPHRDEYSETVGFRISTKNMNVIYIPDINKWNLWNKDIAQVVKDNDLVFIDGTFFKDGELSGVKMQEVPHPFIEETMNLLSSLSDKDKAKVHFIHMNHTNPVLIGDTAATNEIHRNHFQLAKELDEYKL